MGAVQTNILGLTYANGSNTEYCEQWICESLDNGARTTIDGEVIENKHTKQKLIINGVGECLPTCTLTLGELTTATTNTARLNVRLTAQQHTYSKWKFNYTWRFEFVVEGGAA